MTDSRETTAIAPSTDDSAETAPVSISRRTLLRGATVAAPTILTLNSNAAMGWAIASGTIGTTKPSGGSRSAICLDVQSVGGEVKPGVYSLGNPPFADVVDVPSSYKYRRCEDGDCSGTGKKTDLRPEQVCSEGGTIQVKAGGGWKQLKSPVNPNRYPLVSSTAVSSFGTRIVRKDVTTL